MSGKAEVRSDWSAAEVTEIYALPLPDLIFRAQTVHRRRQALCFLAGANSIFGGEKLLTTPNPGPDEDVQLLNTLGMKPLESHAL